MALSKYSIKILRAAGRAIVNEPELFDQSNPPNAAIRVSEVCGTPCCIAGWCAWINHPNPKDYFHAISLSGGAELLAREAKISKPQADRIFCADIEQAADCPAWIEKFIARETAA